MAPSIQVFVQVALLCCVFTTSIGGITDWQKGFSQLEKKVNEQQGVIESLHQIIEHLEKRLEQLEVKGEFGDVLIQPAGPILSLSVIQGYPSGDHRASGFIHFKMTLYVIDEKYMIE